MDPISIAIKIANRFAFAGNLQECQQLNGGQINDTFRMTYADGDTTNRYILQMINRKVFEKPADIMKNIAQVTKHLRRKIAEEGGDPDREALTVVLTKNGDPVLRDDYGEYWRAYRYIENTTAYEQALDTEMIRDSARALGHFQRQLGDFPAESLLEIIPGFHDTKGRYEAFVQAVADNLSGRLDTCIYDVVFLEEHRHISEILKNAFEEGKIPLRVIHNDAKQSNILIDNDTNKAVCVIDLDTVMPGLSAWDFGDAVRFGASTAAEDEDNLDKVRFDLKRYEAYTEGFMEGCAGALTESEIDMMPYGALVMTYEQALRFLGDYLNGDTYYKTEYPTHNLVRARTQIQLIRGMEASFERMREITEKYAQSGRAEAERSS